MLSHFAAQSPDPIEMHSQIGEMLGKDAGPFIRELWALLADAQSQPTGIPMAMIEAKRREIEDQQRRSAAGAMALRAAIGGAPVRGGEVAAALAATAGVAGTALGLAGDASGGAMPSALQAAIARARAAAAAIGASVAAQAPAPAPPPAPAPAGHPARPRAPPGDAGPAAGGEATRRSPPSSPGGRYDRHGGEGHGRGRWEDGRDRHGDARRQPGREWAPRRGARDEDRPAAALPADAEDLFSTDRRRRGRDDAT